MSFSKLLGTLRDAQDILRHTKSPPEVLRALVPALSRPIVLNDGDRTPSGVTPVELAERLARLQRRLEAEVLDAAGRADYRRLSRSDTFAELGATSAALAHVHLALEGDAERIAFWVNLYNILALHGVVALGIEHSVMEKPSFFGRVAYRVAGHVLTLDDIENGVLRRSAPHPVTGKPPFGPADPRLALCPRQVDPRIHAALVCAARSCPPIALYDAAHLDEQLDAACAGFVAQGVALDAGARVVRLPLVFRWYAADFGGEDGVRAFVLRHAPEDRRAALAQAFAEGHALAYHRYDWRLNASDA